MSHARLLPRQWLETPLEQIAALAPAMPLGGDRYPNVIVKREDLLCPKLGGNKIYKLYYHLHRAISRRCRLLASFGGAYSNHLFALAAAGEQLGFATLGVIRGERPVELSSTLEACESMGMTLKFISRRQYRSKHLPVVQQDLGLSDSDIYVIPEGGSGLRGALGMACYGRALSREFPDIKHVMMACGTGASAAGLIAGLPQNVTVHGVCVLKGTGAMLAKYDWQIRRQARFLRRLRGTAEVANFVLHKDFHGGGYGPMGADQMRRLQQLLPNHEIPLDCVYTGKLLLATLELIGSGEINEAEPLLVIHSGGLQGGRLPAFERVKSYNGAI